MHKKSLSHLSGECYKQWGAGEFRCSKTVPRPTSRGVALALPRKSSKERACLAVRRWLSALVQTREGREKKEKKVALGPPAPEWGWQCRCACTRYLNGRPRAVGRMVLPVMSDRAEHPVAKATGLGRTHERVLPCGSKRCCRVPGGRCLPPRSPRRCTNARSLWNWTAQGSVAAEVICYICRGSAISSVKHWEAWEPRCSKAVPPLTSRGVALALIPNRRKAG